MNLSREYLELSLEHIESGLKLFIYPEPNSFLSEIEEEEALKNGESRFQLLEGNSYEYKLSNDKFRLQCSVRGVVTISNRDKSSGRIIPNTYVGTLTIFISNEKVIDKEHPIYLEVFATKLNCEIDKSYRENYRFMLKSITEKCTELLMQINSPVNQHFETDFGKNYETIYQRFAFVQSIISSNEFNEAVQRIVSLPVTNWAGDFGFRDIRSIRKINSSAIHQIATSSNRSQLPDDHFLRTQYNINDIPTSILTRRKVETVDTPENRFIKYALEVFLKFCTDCENIFAREKYSRPQKEALVLIVNLENHLHHPLFKEVSRPTTLRLNSPVLQRKSGYREILNTWLMFDLAAKLIWKGGENVYQAGKRDIAVLYEYWLFFTLYDFLKGKFHLKQHSYDEKPYEHLIVPTNDGLNVMVKSGKHTALEGVFDSGVRKFSVKFSYNRTFSGGKKYDKKEAGSWTKALRPDYTLSIWPAGIKETTAEEKELIVHMHFDSKYKVNQFVVETDIVSDSEEGEDSLEKEKNEERKGNYKNADLLKMHAYNDAIRRTGGAYILYPGTEKQEPLRGFHEIIPGLGAFAIRPSENNSGIKDLEEFIDKVIDHLRDRASQRENISFKGYEVHKEKKEDYNENNLPNILNKSMPEYIGEKKLIPDETFVLIGFYKSKGHLDWILKKNFYNFRTGTDKGSLPLSPKELGAKFLVLHGPGETKTNKIYKLKEAGPRIYSDLDLIEVEYPTRPTGKLYLMFEIEKDISSDFNNQKWDIRKLGNYSGFRDSAIPITISITELMKVIIKS